MSTVTKRTPAPRDAGSVENRLARLLEAPGLARVVPHLPPETLHQLIRHCGLEACVTAATPAQLTALFDLDLWRTARPGHDARFDVDRFGEWLDVLLDTGEAVASRTVAALDADIVVAGPSRYIRVFDPGIFEPTAPSDDELTNRHEAMRDGEALDGDGPPDAEAASLECEVGGHLVRARRTDRWDAVVALLATLDAEHHRAFQAVMRGCRRLSNSRPELDGLDDLLQAPEQHRHDVATGRERRRAEAARPARALTRLLGSSEQVEPAQPRASTHGTVMAVNTTKKISPKMAPSRQ